MIESLTTVFEAVAPDARALGVNMAEWASKEFLPVVNAGAEAAAGLNPDAPTRELG